MNVKINVSGITNNLVAVNDITVDVNYTAEEVIAIIGAYKDLIPAIVEMVKAQNSITPKDV